ncbi:Major facilitator superfamily MFS_1 [Sinomonas atrocyanea]|uniref:Major facilitator superfamily MFS_1 n=1 Tax=Sinomonas atrocyanea TaxID=37927 RepID=A0A127A194_9MICC|nr:MFS transporter [Sinomonas atrocyanea]AMM33220.1 Major facilitator superfamily MFS_1 [Sinomonas atrocyanea]GEB65757.1 MFS transporter [Sinomonas atrocyanea]
MAEEHGGTRGRRPWRGRILVLVGLLAVAFTLRTAVTSVPALTDRIAGEMFLPSWLVGILGMLPTALFGVAGLLTPLLMRAWSVEAIAVAAMAAAAAGQAVRSAAPGTGVFLAGSALALAGMGAGNVVLPPMVRKYFPDRVGLLTALYVTVINVGTTVPPLLAVPVADAAGWRASLGWWAAVNVLAVLPWLTVWPARRGRASDRGAGRAAGAAAASPAYAAADGARPPRAVVRPWHSPAAWALALLFGCTSLNTYTMFAWLPSIVGGAGLDAAAAGFQLSLFAGLGLPLSLAVPVLAARLRNPFPVVAFGVATFAAGYLGLALAPDTATWLWSTLAGLGPATFPLALVLVNLRTRSHQAAGAVSGFAQGVGYVVACAGPLAAGLLHDATGAWTASFVFLGLTLAVLGVSGWVISRPHFIDDHPGVVVRRGAAAPPPPADGRDHDGRSFSADRRRR